jgi:hypothetical protein
LLSERTGGQLLPIRPYRQQPLHHQIHTRAEVCEKLAGCLEREGIPCRRKVFRSNAHSDQP